MNLNNQGVQITAIVGIVVIVLALIGATVYAPGSGVNNLLTLIGGVVTVLLGLAKLQSIGQQTQENSQTIARVEEKVNVVHESVNGLNKAALVNQAIVSKAEGKAEEKADALERVVTVTPDEPILTQEIKPGDPRYVPPTR